MSTYVIVTARNEAGTIGATVDALAGAFPGSKLIVADDHSTDGTADIAAARGTQVVRNSTRQGKGEAATDAVRALQDKLGPDDVVLFCDADLGRSAERLTELLKPVEAGEADIAVARFERKIGGGVGLAKGFAAWAIKRLTGRRVTAPISGQRAVRVSALEQVMPFASGFGMEMGMTVDALRAGRTLTEAGIDLEHRPTGHDLRGFWHRARQLKDFFRAYLSRRRPD